MKTKEYTLIELTPSDGHKLTQEADVDLANRVVSSKVYLAVNDSPDNWREITDAEAEEIERMKEKDIFVP